jgi:hypothetical protein
MARGIISTILGGVAGGLEGLGVQQQRRRAEEEREREREDRLALQEAQMRNLDLASTLRAYEAGASLTPARRTDAVSRALAEAPSTISAGQRTLDAQAARPLADATRSDLDISRSVLPESALRGEFARQPVDFGRPDPDLYEVPYGDQSFRLPSQAAMARQRGEAAEARALAEKEELNEKFNDLLAMGFTREQAAEAVFGIRQRPSADPVAEPALVRTIEYLRNEFPDMPIEQIVAMASGRQASGSDNERDLVDALRRFASSSSPLTGRAPSTNEIRETARKLAPLYGVSSGFVDEMFSQPSVTGSTFRNIINPRLTSSPEPRLDFFEQEEPDLGWP